LGGGAANGAGWGGFFALHRGWRRGYFSIMSDPAIRFTPRAQQVLALARKEADRFHHNYVGAEHLLLGLVNLGQGVAVSVLQKHGFDLETTRNAVEKQVGIGPEAKPTGNIPYTPRMKKILTEAQKEAKALNHSYVGTEHLLLGLLCESEGAAARVFRQFNLDVKKCRAEILRELDPNFSDDPKLKAALVVLEDPGAPPPNPGEAPPSPAASLPPSEPKTAESKFHWRRLGQWLRNKSPGPSFTGARPLNNFTPRAQRVLALARKEADRFHHNYVGTEHLLLGLISLNQGVAVSVLQKMGLDLETVRNAVEKQVGTGPENKPTGNIPYTPRVKKSLALAQKEAKMLQHSYIGTEHILLGILREGDGVAARVLKILGVDIIRCRNEILHEVDPNFSGEADAFRVVSASAFDSGGNPPTPATAPPGDRLDKAVAEAFGGAPNILTGRVYLALVHARREADWFHHDFIGTEHVLLSVLNQRESIAANLLAKMGVEQAAARAEVEKLITPGIATAPIADPAFTPGVVRALILARAEATALNRPRVGLEHLLLGLLREGDGIAARVLTNLRVDYEPLRTLCAVQPPT
jgi:ATP-dependent Clp protease ATP-binding subunit ClpA